MPALTLTTYQVIRDDMKMARLRDPNLSDVICNLISWTAVANNILQLSSPWVASPASTAITPALATAPGPIIVTTAYAVYEALWYPTLFWLGIPPWIMLIYLSIMHVWFYQYTVFASMSSFIDEMKASPGGLEPKSEPAYSSVERPKAIEDSFRQHKEAISRAFALGDLTAAMLFAAGSNAAFNMFAVDALANQTMPTAHREIIKITILIISLCFFVAKRIIADRQAMIDTGRWGIFAPGTNHWRDGLPQVGCLAYLVMLRISMCWAIRWLTGYEILRLALWPSQGVLRLDAFKLQQWLDLSERHPWLSPAISIFGGILQVTIAWYAARTLKRKLAR